MSQSPLPERSRSEVRASFLPRRPQAMSPIEKAADPRRALRRLVPYLKPYRWSLVLTTACMLVYTLLGLAGPYLMGRAIDGAIAFNDPASLGRLALLLLAAYLFNNLFHAIASWIMARVSQHALQNLRKDLFSHLQSLPLPFFDRNPAGELMSRLTNDIDAVNQAVSQNVISLFASLLSMVGILVTMFILNAWLALATLIVIPILFWSTQFIARYTRKGFRELQKQLGALNGSMEESLSGGRVVQAFRRSDSVLDSFCQYNQAVYRAGVYANTYAMLLMPLTGVLGNFFVIVLSSLGGYLALQGLVSVGTIAAFINYGQNFINPLRQIANVYNSIQAALAGGERVFEIIDTPSESLEASDGQFENIQGHVRLEGVKFEYLPGQPVIRDMTLEAKAGQTVALVGPTGAGKTTIVNLLGRFYDLQAGRITIDGHDIRSLPRTELRRMLGVVLQDTFLFADTVMENIRYGCLEATDAEVMQAAELAGADHFIRQLPQGYQTLLTERAGNLSQGQRQMLSIARAVLADPVILVLDEATSSVDTRTEARIQKALLRLMEGRTSFVIAHRLSTIREADKVVVIDNGRIVEQGTHQELLAQGGFYHRLYQSQFKGQEI